MVIWTNLLRNWGKLGMGPFFPVTWLCSVEMNSEKEEYNSFVFKFIDHTDRNLMVENTIFNGKSEPLGISTS